MRSLKIIQSAIAALDDAASKALDAAAETDNDRKSEELSNYGEILEAARDALIWATGDDPDPACTGMLSGFLGQDSAEPDSSQLPEPGEN